MARKKTRSAAQKRNDKRLGAAAKKRGKPKRIIKRITKRNSPRTNKRKSKPKRNVAKRKSFRSKGVTGVKSFFKGSSLLGKAAMGIGAASIAGIALNSIAPQFSGIGKLGVAFLTGGPIGGVSQLLLGGGLGAAGLGGLGEGVQGLFPQQRTEGAPAGSLTV